jgi:hypothetical protein
MQFDITEENRQEEDYGSAGYRFNSYWVHHFFNRLHNFSSRKNPVCAALQKIESTASFTNP